MHGPIVNLNGADRESLLASHVKVMDAATALRRALTEAAPHGRDYQTDATGKKWGNDRNAWEMMLVHVAYIEDTYRQIAERLATEA